MCTLTGRNCDHGFFNIAQRLNSLLLCMKKYSCLCEIIIFLIKYILLDIERYNLAQWLVFPKLVFQKPESHLIIIHSDYGHPCPEGRDKCSVWKVAQVINSQSELSSKTKVRLLLLSR